jgi:HEAT repeat protein
MSRKQREEFEDDLDLGFEVEEEDSDERPRPSIEEVIKALQSGSDRIPTTAILYGLSGLGEADIDKLEPVLSRLDVTYRRILMQMLVDVSDSNYQLDYDEIGLMTLRDSDAEVRRAAIELLAENESSFVMSRLMRVAQQDKAPSVRADAARTLGNFILLGELGNISEAKAQEAQQCVLSILSNENELIEVRRRALEAIANCSHDTVIPSITAAYQGGDEQMRMSAVIAMGHTADERWEAIVLKELTSRNAEMRQNAARAAGELQIQDAVSHLAQMLDEGERDAQEVAIEALGEIGTKEATRHLNIAMEIATSNDDDDFMTLIENALGNATLANGKLMLLDVDADD